MFLFLSISLKLHSSKSYHRIDSFPQAPFRSSESECKRDQKEAETTKNPALLRFEAFKILSLTVTNSVRNYVIFTLKCTNSFLFAHKDLKKNDPEVLCAHPSPFWLLKSHGDPPAVKETKSHAKISLSLKLLHSMRLIHFYRIMVVVKMKIKCSA